MIRRPPRSTRTDTLSLHDALPIFKSDGNDGFILPRPNPDAQPAPSSSDADDADLPAPIADAPKAGGKEADDQERQYDFYTVLPGQEVAMSDAELAASRSEEHTSELQSLMRISYAVFCLKKKTHKKHEQQ